MRPRLNTTGADAALSAAWAGFGVSNIVSHQAEAHLREGRLQQVLGEFTPDALPVHLVHRGGAHASKAARAFIDFAIDGLRDRLGQK